MARLKRKIQEKPESENPEPSPKNPPKTIFPLLPDFKKQLESWEEILTPYTSTPKFKHTYDFVSKKYETEKCYPPIPKIFNAFALSNFQTLKVVIVGQDPYHQPGQAMGLCFSIPKNFTKIPPSLKNIYKCLEKDPKVKNFKKPNHGDLTKWAQQGVFLLNAMLSVTQSKPMSHKKSKWMDFTDYVIRVISQKKENVIFLLWGNPAKKKVVLIDEKKHHVLKACHPSPLSATKGGFFDCGHFSRVNEILKEQGREVIDWSL